MIYLKCFYDRECYGVVTRTGFDSGHDCVCLVGGSSEELTM